MKKNKALLRLAASFVILLAVYHLVVFFVPFVHTATFWVSYGFTLAAFAVVAAAMHIAFVRNPDAKSRFYGFPIARIGVVYGVVQLVVGFGFMAVAKWILAWPAVIVCALGLGAAAIGLIAAESVVEEIAVQDDKLKKNVSLMRDLQTKVSRLTIQCDDEKVLQEVRALAEELRCSDPVSAEVLAEAEAELSAVVDALQAAVVAGDTAQVGPLCRKATAALAERNRLCKLSK